MSRPLSHERKPNLCPYCGRDNNRMADTREHKDAPKPGDISICFGCTKVAIIVSDTETRRISTQERDALPIDDRMHIEMSRHALRQAKERKNES